MHNEELLTAPSRLGFLIWIKGLLAAGSAKVSTHNGRVIELNTQVSSCFALGRRRQNNTPIISCDYSITPYLFSLFIQKVAVDMSGGIYLIYGRENMVLALKLKVSTKRLLMVNLENMLARGKGSSIDFYSHYADEKNKEAHMSKVLHKAELVKISDISEIIPKNTTEGLYYTGLLEEQTGGYDIYDPDNFDKFMGEGYENSEK